ncbi:MAG: hypothetical protein J5802_00990 [Butyrivibrio sp.]|nr:hypothetical protein [Butyrivibrio sp.]
MDKTQRRWEAVKTIYDDTFRNESGGGANKRPKKEKIIDAIIGLFLIFGFVIVAGEAIVSAVTKEIIKNSFVYDNLDKLTRLYRISVFLFLISAALMLLKYRFIAPLNGQNDKNAKRQKAWDNALSRAFVDGEKRNAFLSELIKLKSSSSVKHATIVIVEFVFNMYLVDNGIIFLKFLEYGTFQEYIVYRLLALALTLLMDATFNRFFERRSANNYYNLFIDDYIISKM